jgi:quercetin dioxygenase-like cupin family protein
MLSVNQPKGLGDLNITIYDFEKIGDIVEMHTHDESANHITIVARGKIRAHGEGWSQEAEQGKMLDFQVGVAHELTALEDGTRIYNILKKYVC